MTFENEQACACPSGRSFWNW